MNDTALGEFDLIRRYFTAGAHRHTRTSLGIGDDCAILRPQPGFDLAVTVDTLVEGVHFLAGTDAERLGHKALAVNLSDLAAMGAQPAWVTLALTLPHVDEAWLSAFSSGFLALAKRSDVELVGGDTTRGPLSITVQAMGYVEADKALRRSGAKAGDAVYVTGSVGLAGVGLKSLLGYYDGVASEAIKQLEQPEARVQAGRELLGFAHACIDVSDGLSADLGHILDASKVGAALDWEALPLHDEVRQYIARTGDWLPPLVAGDDYELCFTMPPQHEPQLAAALAAVGTGFTRIGMIESEPGLRLLRNGQLQQLPVSGYQHFRK
ncbi:thiamine-phosphate kinase [Candidatus Methylospira mobilis]|uniref:Thiamine-monophosphate kinase n=1 Tax=Candidatus Methylospira mobilis TaxID=1808979 RepID=A0A5Q0BM80_9GAMM|nr:thiamine-phosphate kinase [Candidatus Methylospira mobilis]QFY43334.1 thiamine-phosphate kinase [Candidatus Methylospira mobilis]WNV03449.1 thiamine-phosphate kinase [Candidatus Methylospira mobilis]